MAGLGKTRSHPEVRGGGLVHIGRVFCSICIGCAFVQIVDMGPIRGHGEEDIGVPKKVFMAGERETVES